MSIEFVKAHGTENDFVLFFDPDSSLDLTAARIQAICDRRQGIGADGILRIVRLDTGRWFMDYRNADGSLAEMCGNGARVVAKYLVEEAKVLPYGEFVLDTRGGARQATVSRDGTVSIDMGPVTTTGDSTAVIDQRSFLGTAVNVGNPHLACLIDQPIDELDLTRQPGYDQAAFPDGANIEFANALNASPNAGQLRMRVWERGVGETRSCGTAAVAVTAAWLHSMGTNSGAAEVVVPGGRLSVTVADGTSVLTGPVVFVARGELDTHWWKTTDLIAPLSE